MAAAHVDLCGNFAWISFWVKNPRETWIPGRARDERAAGDDLSARTEVATDRESRTDAHKRCLLWTG